MSLYGIDHRVLVHKVLIIFNEHCKKLMINLNSDYIVIGDFNCNMLGELKSWQSKRLGNHR